MPYSYNFDASFSKSANLGILKDLKTLSNPNYKPFTTIINDVRNALDSDRMQPQQALIELKNRIFAGPGSLVSTIDTLFRKAFHFSSSPESIKLYGNISALIKQLYDKLFSPFAAKLAVYDPAKYNELLNRLDGSLDIANQVEQSIKFLSTEMQSLQGIGSELPPREQFEGEIPSMEREEVNEKEEEAEKTQKISSILSNFVQRLSNPKEFENIRNMLIPALQQSLPGMAKTMDRPEKLPLHMNVDGNLQDLAEYSKKGFFGLTNEAVKSEYLKMLTYIEKAMDISGTKSVPDNLEELLIAYPLLLGQLTSALKSKIYRGGKEKNVAFEDTSTTSALDNLKFNQDQFNMQRMVVAPGDEKDAIFEDLSRFDIHSRDDFEKLAQFVYEKSVKPTYQEMIHNPYQFSRINGEISVDALPQEMQKAVALNRAGFKFALYQLNSNQSFITALKNEYDHIRKNLFTLSQQLNRKKMDPAKREETKKVYLAQAKESEQQIIGLMQGVLARCFPEELVNAARSSMQNTFPEDVQMLAGGPVELGSSLLYAKLLPYNEMLKNMAETICRSNVKNNQYFIFVSREGLGEIISSAYGGLYGDKMRGSYKERISPTVHPNFFNRPVVLEPLADKDKPFFAHNDVEGANQYMEFMESDIRFSVRKKIDNLEESGQIDEEDALKSLFYIAFSEASSEYLKESHWARETGEEPQPISVLWKKKFQQLSAVDPFEKEPEPELVGTKQSSLYIFPLKYLFK